MEANTLLQEEEQEAYTPQKLTREGGGEAWRNLLVLTYKREEEVKNFKKRKRNQYKKRKRERVTK